MVAQPEPSHSPQPQQSPVSLGMADATRVEDAAWLALEEIAVTVMRGTCPGGVATADRPDAGASSSGRERVWKVLMIATDYFEKNPSQRHDDVRQLVRNVRPRAETPPPSSGGGLFSGAFPSSGGGIFGGPSSGGVFNSPTSGGGTPPKEKK